MLHHHHFACQQAKAETLIVLHGLFGSSQNWRQICKQLSQQWEVYALDLRNHGKSPHLDSMSYTDMASDVIAFMQQHDIQHAHILGHSMGGKVAIETALVYPQHIDSLIIADIAPVQYPPRHHDVFEAIAKINREQPTSRKAADDLVKDILPETGLRLFLLTNLNRADANGVDWKVNIDAIINNYSDISAAPAAILAGKQFAKPTCVIKGGLSPYIKDDSKAVFEAAFPQISFATIENAGHWLHAEQPEQFLKLVHDFLNTL